MLGFHSEDSGIVLSHKRRKLGNGRFWNIYIYMFILYVSIYIYVYIYIYIYATPPQRPTLFRPFLQKNNEGPKVASFIAG